MTNKCCETCGKDFEVVMGRGFKNRITCYECTDGDKKLTYRNKHLKKKYGITHYEYLQMFENQKGLCGVCQNEMNQMSGTPTKGESRNGRDCCVDHDHNTGKIRGLLCFHCNTALGHLFDDVSLLDKISNYLR